MTPTSAARKQAPARSAGHRTVARATSAPRRVSGPVHRPAVRRPAGARIALPRPAAIGAWTSAFVRSLPDARLLDRVVRGRSWIPILGVMLVGIVAMQVEILKLGANTGRSLERVTALQSRNQQLLSSVAVLADDQRIERLAFRMNMVMPGPTQVRFLDPRANAVGHALNAIHVPNATTFLAALPSIAAAASAGSTATTTAATGTTASGTTGTPAGGATTNGATTNGATTSAAPASAASATAATATGPAPVTPSSSATASGAAPAVPTGASTTNTGVPSTSSAAAPSPAPSSSAPAATPSTTTPNGATAVPAAG